MSTILVTGGTGLLGREVVARLTAAGHTVRILSHAATDPRAVKGDLATGSGLDAAVDGVAAIVHCASNGRDPQHSLTGPDSHDVLAPWNCRSHRRTVWWTRSPPCAPRARRRATR